MLAWKPEEKVEVKEPAKIDIQKSIEEVMSQNKTDGFISPAVDDEDEIDVDIELPGKEAKPFPISKSDKKPAKTGLIIFIAGGLTAAYAWFTGLF